MIPSQTERETERVPFIVVVLNSIQIFASVFSCSRVVPTSLPVQSSDDENLRECPICCEQIRSTELKRMTCCSTQLCGSCIRLHLTAKIRIGKVQVQCPTCVHEIDPSTILYNTELPLTVRELYQQSLAQDLSEKQNGSIKLCPHCSFITIVDENKQRSRKKIFSRRGQEWLRCEQCNEHWCWSCYAPSHPSQTCRQFKANHSQLDRWAQTRRSDNPSQRNAQRCPKCSIYIEKTEGCDHMQCTKCNSKFCYRCGDRMITTHCIGHDSKYSILGCKYKLWPNRPMLRWLVRGSIAIGALLLSPIALAALIILLVIAIPTLLIIGILVLPVFLYVRSKKR